MTAPTQGDKFKEAAKKHGADEDSELFDKTLKRIAKAPPPDTVQDRKRPKPKAKGEPK